LPEFLKLNLRKFYRKNFSNLLPHNYDKSYFTTVDSLALEIYGKTVVSSWLNISDNRKNFEILIKAYTQASRANPDSTLLIKIIGHSSELEKAKLILSNLQDRFPNRLPPIILIHGSLEDSTMYALRNATDIYLNTSSTEGICLPALEHAIHGVTVVLPRNSAFLDYFSESSANFYDVDFTPTHFPGDPREKLHTSWNPPLFKDLVEVLKVSIENSPLDRKRDNRSKVQQKLKAGPEQFVRDLLGHDGSR
jgi:glycosyltransferase involved in cell wall biosynthesis